jgi:uncharacterized protein involved in outer membrane biogenesis
MRALRRLVHVISFAGTLVVGAVAVSLIVSQTAWFRNWLRGYIVEQAQQYLEGDLTIGRLDGNLFFGVALSDVAVEVSRDRVIAVKKIAVDYSVADLVSQSVVLDAIRLTSPSVRLERDVEGWNVGRLVKKQRREADREGPGRSFGQVHHHHRRDRGDYRWCGLGELPLAGAIDDLDVKARFDYACAFSLSWII